MKPQGLRLMFGAGRFRFTLMTSLAITLLLKLGSDVPLWMLALRVIVVGLSVMLAFGIFEQWPRRLPHWLDRWILQLVGIVLIITPAALLACLLLRMDGTQDFWQDNERLAGFAKLAISGLLFAPWIALGAMIRQRDVVVRDQAESFALERSELERQAMTARLRLLQAQIEPHFLFNTLANMQALVDTGSPQASKVLRSLVAYLRAAIPRLHEPEPTLDRELHLVRAYLDVMHMRIPDRLHYAFDIEPGAGALRCPPMTILTLVENAVRHGIDPAEEGGRIDIVVRVSEGRCRIRVQDTGIGLHEGSDGAGTGLSSLRQRLQLYFGGDAQLDVHAVEPAGVLASLNFPAIPAQS